MCYAAGSVDQAVNVCPMCIVFPHARCPHVRDVCRNRALHPRMDVIFMKNAEVDLFNGCGYCKWARSNPPSKQAGYNNIGHPGCCRPPATGEYRLIQAADWRSVSIIHHTPIPDNVKAALESILNRGSPVGSGKVLDRNRIPSIASPSARPTSLSCPRPDKSSPNALPGKSATGSPQDKYISLSRNHHPTAASTSVPTPSTMEQHMVNRCPLIANAEKPSDGAHPAHALSTRNYIDLVSPPASNTPRRLSSVRRPSPGQSKSPTGSSNAFSVAEISTLGRRRSMRRASLSNPNAPSRKSSPGPLPPARQTAFLVVHRSSHKVEEALSSASSSSGSSDSLGSRSDSTVTSDGGFTDYLSDESEAELQRQAEAKAALVAQNQAEELEFKAARLQLAHVDLRPPKSWNPDTKPVKASQSVSKAPKNWNPTNITNNATAHFPASAMMVYRAQPTGAVYPSSKAVQADQAQAQG